MRFGLVKLIIFTIFSVCQKFSYAENITLSPPFDILDKKTISCKLQPWNSDSTHHPDKVCDLEGSILFKGYASDITIGLKNNKLQSITIIFNEKYKNSNKLKFDLFRNFNFDFTKNQTLYSHKVNGILYSYMPDLLTLDITNLNLK